MVKLTQSFFFSNDLVANFTIETFGQDDPANSDLLVGKATLALPADGAGNLHPDLCFGERLEVLGRPLVRSWGKSTAYVPFEDNTKSLQIIQKGEKWDDIFQRLFKIIEEDLAQLEAAIRARKKALNNGWSKTDFIKKWQLKDQ